MLSTRLPLWLYKRVIYSLIFRPHCSTTYIDAACCYGLNSVAYWSVAVVTPTKMAEPIEMPFGLWGYWMAQEIMY